MDDTAQISRCTVGGIGRAGAGAVNSLLSIGSGETARAVGTQHWGSVAITIAEAHRSALK
jgi:hypothetical protein